ncbi:hypothetical protein [uncultured Bacteroides sp.]|uniref:hypothetical protein n=1 Tax=uncultured Bacteroides sp. TaxID=162156 RepID=UPI0025D3690F|nr:hypothetical protein [uncultured Bacteroides sp.]
MEGLMQFTGIVIIAFGILQIILFFKIWGMTNDVRQLKNEFMGNSDDWTLKKAILKGDKDLISKMLFNEMFFEIRELYNDSIPDTEGDKKKIFEDKIASLKNRFKKRYLKYEIDFPCNIDKIETLDDLEKI